MESVGHSPACPPPAIDANGLLSVDKGRWTCRIRAAARIRAYDVAMADLPVIEDERGVDISQIRRQLALPVPERVRVMVEAANTMIAMADHAQRR